MNTTWSPMYQPPDLKVALGLGDQELEQRLRPALENSEGVAIVAQCLAADQLLEVSQSGLVDAVVVAWSLHRLTNTLLNGLDRPGLGVVLLVPDPADEQWQHRPGSVLGVDSDAKQVLQAVLDLRRGVRQLSRPRLLSAERVTLKPADGPLRESGTVIAVGGGVGSPGRTTVAINLAVALGVGASAVLVEVDLSAPAIAAYLDRDPSRNLCTLAHTVRDGPHLWSAALSDELQPLGPRQLSSVVLCGPPKREMRTSVSPPFLEQLIRELAARHRWVILDVGDELLGVESAATGHRAALARAHHIVLVSSADLVGLWHARTAIEQMERLVGIDRQRVSLVLNRHDARYHHSRQEVEWHLGLPVAAVVPFDYRAAQRAMADQRPLILDSSSRAARALLGLAERLHEGKLRLPVDSAVRRTRMSWWQRLWRWPLIVPTTGHGAHRKAVPAPRVGVLQEVGGRRW